MVLDLTPYHAAMDKHGADYGIPYGTPREFFEALTLSRPGVRNFDLASMARGGLMQITEKVRKDFNKQTGNDYSRRALQNEPEKSIEISSWLLGRIIRYYQEIFPALGIDWASSQFVGLVSLGYLAGHSGPPRSRGRGTGYVISTMLDKGISPSSITAQTIAQVAPVIKAAKTLYDPRIQNRVNSIVEAMHHASLEGEKTMTPLPQDQNDALYKLRSTLTPSQNRVLASILDSGQLNNLTGLLRVPSKEALSTFRNGLTTAQVGQIRSAFGASQQLWFDTLMRPEGFEEIDLEDIPLPELVAIPKAPTPPPPPQRAAMHDASPGVGPIFLLSGIVFLAMFLRR